jgi:hypothetical protein
MSCSYLDLHAHLYLTQSVSHNSLPNYIAYEPYYYEHQGKDEKDYIYMPMPS